MKWYGRAAEQGNVHAQHNLGVMYSVGLGLTQDHIEAAKADCYNKPHVVPVYCEKDYLQKRERDVLDDDPITGGTQ